MSMRLLCNTTGKKQKKDSKYTVCPFMDACTHVCVYVNVSHSKGNWSIIILDKDMLWRRLDTAICKILKFLLFFSSLKQFQALGIHVYFCKSKSKIAVGCVKFMSSCTGQRWIDLLVCFYLGCVCACVRVCVCGNSMSPVIPLFYFLASVIFKLELNLEWA